MPEVLLNGNHAEIEAWRRREAIRNTALKRPELISTAKITQEERLWAERIMRGEET